MLASHAIDPAIERLLKEEDVSGFLERRQQRVTGDLRTFLERKCEWGFENTSPLVDLEIDDLDDGNDAA